MFKGLYYFPVQSREFLLVDSNFNGIIPLISPLHSLLIYSAATWSLLHTI